LTKTAGQCPQRREDLVGAEPERQLADPPATWQEHWFDHRQLLRLYHSDEHCAIYVDPGVRRADDDERAVAVAEVTTFEGSGGTARVSLRAESGHT
jgi:hypothetical protein